MAYDLFVAVCKPLLYNTVMSPKVCSSLMLGSYLMAFSGAMAHTGCMLRLTFCDANSINHYFCDIHPLLQLSCTSTYVIELVVFIMACINIIVPSLTIFVSYGLILFNILHISSTESRSTVFTTCSSHIIAVSLFFGSGAFVYLKSSSTGSLDEGKISSVFYTNTVPLLNPLIYSLRNKDVKLALKKRKPWIRDSFDQRVSVCAVGYVTRRFCAAIIYYLWQPSNPIFFLNLIKEIWVFFHK